jgi:hypothetical protein
MPAARRMFLALALLMVLMALAVSLTPPPPSSSPREDRTAVRPGSDTAQQFVDARLFVTEDSEPEIVEAEVGETIRLEIHGTDYDGVELRGLELFSAVSPEAPAIFEILAEESGRFPILLTESDRQIGAIEISRPS